MLSNQRILIGAAVIGSALMLLGDDATAALVTTGPILWSSGVGGNDHYYALVMPDQIADNFSGTSANAAATVSTYLGSQGHLVTVTSLAEHQFLEQNFASLIRPGPPEIDFIWIGLTDVAQEGTFAWVTGEPFSFQRWAGTEPNNINNEDYVHYWRRDGLFEWNDSISDPTFTNLRGYIVEYDGPFRAATVPEPASLLVWLAAVFAAACTRPLSASSSVRLLFPCGESVLSEHHGSSCLACGDPGIQFTAVSQDQATSQLPPPDNNSSTLELR